MSSNLNRRLERLEQRAEPFQSGFKPMAPEEQERRFAALRARVESGQATPAEFHRYSQICRMMERAKARQLAGFALEMFKTNDETGE